jgi:non-ribosomal peptide synthase protein (TIGR01720 family)
LSGSFVAPRGPLEETLADIWAEVLGVEQIGVDDNFFDLGGDSILSLQIIARANVAGLSLTPQQLFQHQTIAELAAVAGTENVLAIETGRVSGPVPLTPIQHWFFEEPITEPHHYNQMVLLELRQPMNADLLSAAVAHLLEHHDALRLRFERTANGWQQINAEHESHHVFERVDLSLMDEKAQKAALEAATARAQTSLNLTEGPLLRVVLFDCGANRPSRLLIVIHHLAVDGVSWRILLADLEKAYGQLACGAEPNLGAKTTSFKQWAEQLQEFAASTELKREFDYWLETKRYPGSGMIIDRVRSENTVASARAITVALSTEETRLLLYEVSALHHTQVHEVLLTALTQAYQNWSGERRLLIDIEGHGREGTLASVDLSRTVGWFTSINPLALDLGDASTLGEALKRVKEQVRSMPRRGIGYGVSRYIADGEGARQLRVLPAAEISFNYLGRLDQVLEHSAYFTVSGKSFGASQSPRRKRRYLIEIDGGVIGGQLRMHWTYSENVHLRSTVRQLAKEFIESLRKLIAHCQTTEAKVFTPSDFPLAQLNQHKLNKLSSLLNKR